MDARDELVKINYKGDNFFVKGLKELSQSLGIVLSKNGKEIVAEQTDRSEINVFSDGEKTRFTYYDKASFFRAFSIALQKLTEGGGSATVKPLIKHLGTMHHCAHSVLNIETVKSLIRNNAITGYNYIQLYTEVSYEIPSEPYFGYKLGKYTQKELKELVAYSEMFGVEMIPCIQTLAHLQQLFKWAAFGDMLDIKDTLLVGYDRTYELIDKMICSLRQCFKTDKINLGMDEAYYMGFGRYKWFIDDGVSDRSLLFIKHLRKVLEIAKKYGFNKPSIWFDNLIGMNYKGYIDPPVWLWKDIPAYIQKDFPAVRLIYWNYGIRSIDEFKRLTGYVKQLSKNISFASMAYGYTSFAPENYVTETLTDTAKNGCAICGIDDVMITFWGGMISPHALIPSYFNYSERLCESEGVDLESRCKFLFGYSYTQFNTLDIPNYIGNRPSDPISVEDTNLPFYALASDPLLGKADTHIPENCEKDYAIKAKKLSDMARRNSPYSVVFKFESVLCSALSKKAELGIKIKTAYDKKDTERLKDIAEAIPDIIKSVKNLHSEYREYYSSFAKSQGLAEWDMRFGGLILRLEQVKTTLLSYIDGKLKSISELEEERLPVCPDKVGKVISYADWNSCACAD